MSFEIAEIVRDPLPLVPGVSFYDNPMIDPSLCAEVAHAIDRSHVYNISTGRAGIVMGNVVLRRGIASPIKDLTDLLLESRPLLPEGMAYLNKPEIRILVARSQGGKPVEFERHHDAHRDVRQIVNVIGSCEFSTDYVTGVKMPLGRVAIVNNTPRRTSDRPYHSTLTRDPLRVSFDLMSAIRDR